MVCSMNVEPTVHEQASLQDYQSPGMYTVQQNNVGHAESKQIHYLHNHVMAHSSLITMASRSVWQDACHQNH
jgi:hypothetical protein